jgi:hypothetical protein
MKGILRRLRPSPAMVVACTALVFAMTGAGYAAGMLGPNTVGTKQLKKNAVISSKVKNRSLLAVDFKAGQLPRGAQGPQGLPGAQGAQGIQGIQGPPGPFPDGDIPAGKTIRGTLFVFGSASGAGQYFDGEINFGFSLPAAPTVRYINQGTTPPAQCPGNVTNPQAQPGNLCIYERLNINAPTRFAYNPLNNGFNQSSRYGTGVAVYSGASGQVEIDASWAVTSAAATAAAEGAPASKSTSGAAQGD